MAQEPYLPSRRSGALPGRPHDSANLADILERVLDKGIVIAGDIQINLLDIELLTIKLRLLIASVDRAREMGISWWESDPTLQSSSGRAGLERGADDQDRLERENRELRERLERLERRLDAGDESVQPGDEDVEPSDEDVEPSSRSRTEEGRFGP